MRQSWPTSQREHSTKIHEERAQVRSFNSLAMWRHNTNLWSTSEVFSTSKDKLDSDDLSSSLMLACSPYKLVSYHCKLARKIGEHKLHFSMQGKLARKRSKYKLNFNVQGKLAWKMDKHKLNLNVHGDLERKMRCRMFKLDRMQAQMKEEW